MISIVDAIREDLLGLIETYDHLHIFRNREGFPFYVSEDTMSEKHVKQLFDIKFQDDESLKQFLLEIIDEQAFSIKDLAVAL